MQNAFIRKLYEFANAMQDGDFLSATSWCELPLTILRPNGAVIFNSKEDIAKDLAQSWTPYARSGIAAISPHILEFRNYAQGVFLGDVEWRFFDHSGQVQNTIFSTYSLLSVEGELRVAVIIAHNEMHQRPFSELV